MRTLVAGAVLLASTLGISSSAAHSGARSAKPFAITSTLDGMTTLPQRIHWIARPTGSASKVEEVLFLVDGKIAWIEHKPAPYVYGNKGNWLVTSALTPGEHRFTVRMTTSALKTVSKTVNATVLPAAPPPATLAGSWERSVTKEQAGEAPVGIWGITIDSTGWKIRGADAPRDCGCGDWIDAAYVSANGLELRSGIWTQPNNDQVKLGGNGWCNDTNAPVAYNWAVSANTLTITLNGPDLCGDFSGKQSGIVAGVWTRVG